MKKLIIILTAAVAILFSGCASMFVPDSDLIDKLPIVKIGSEKPAGHEYILHVPAGVEFPINFSVKGNLISSPVESKLSTRVNHELYIYKFWTSLDGKNWQPSRDLINMPITIGVDPEGAQMHVKVDLQK